ncbi:pyridoxal 5'-phosphate synthase [Arthrobacter sp.]|uniref:pyridoxine/pyridoxamine 5'-phosphate oxidase n=1 Tax=Arthrobacter sp. TaxID=1667 RepID=UPI0026DF76DE|nr:pyridoxal 5'-phosphate synthase [Arthrobacter sp.]MDO5754506.1 pyridoxal 5'-phosphate synthase [Arthrobacter sp.]
MQTLRDELRAIPSIVGKAPGFDLASAPQTPQELFLVWLRQAVGAGVPEPHAATLSTVDRDGLPDARVLIIKDVTDDCGFKISTSDESAKGRQLGHNPNCALTFFWSPLARAVRVRGIAQRASTAESAADFLARHPHTRVFALAGQQSSVIPDSATRDEEIARAKAEVESNKDVRSPHWAVWTIAANSVEFWQGDPSRDHQRLRYVRTGSGWDTQRLRP